MEYHYCTSDMERILEGLGSFICLPLADKAAKTNRSVGLWTWFAVLAAIGVVGIVLGCALRVVWGSYCRAVLAPPYFYWLQLRLRLLHGGRRLGCGGQGGQGQDDDRNLELGARPRCGYAASDPGPIAPPRLHVPQPLGASQSMGDILFNSIINENYVPSRRDSILCPDCPGCYDCNDSTVTGCYDSTATTQLDDSGSTVYAGMDAARTSTPQAGCRKGSTRSLDALDQGPVRGSKSPLPSLSEVTS